jgi:hypothetical protein
VFAAVDRVLEIHSSMSLTSMYSTNTRTDRNRFAEMIEIAQGNEWRRAES